MEKLEQLEQLIADTTKQDQKILGEISDISLSIDSFSNRQILAWGCGSGKTTKLAYHLATTDKTHLVVVKTNEEIDRLTNLVLQFNENSSILAYHSGDDEILKELERDNTYLSKYKILVTNNWRFLNDPSFLLFEVKVPPTPLQRFTKNVSNYRDIVIFDEFPQLYREEKVNVGSLWAELCKNETLIDSGFKTSELKNGVVTERPILESPLAYAMQGIYSFKHTKILDIANRTIDNLESVKNILQVQSKSETINYLTELRMKEIVANAINKLLDNSDFYLKQGKTNTIDWIVDIETVLPCNKETKILILDATAEIMFETSTLWKIDKRYHKPITINHFNLLDLGTNRYITNSNVIKKIDILKEDIDRLDKYLGEHLDKKHLIVTWKNIGNLGVSMPDEILKRCKNTNYNVTYYGSGKTRATNEFIDCDSIIFFGDWFLSDKTIEKLNQISKSNMTSQDFILAEMIQAVYRTSARLPDNKGVDLVVTSKFTLKSDFGDLKDRLFNILTFGQDKDKALMNKVNRICKSEIRSDLFDKLKLFLNKYNINKIPKQLEDFYVDFDELYKLIPYRNKKSRSYDKLKGVLKTYYNINLVIKTK